jgi:hypothetical protein
VTSRKRGICSEIHLDGLPRAGPVLNRDLDPHCVGEVHFADGGFDPKTELVEAQLQSLLEFAEPGGAVALQTEIQILGRAGALCEPQLQATPPFR